MGPGLIIKERMSGWIAFYDDISCHQYPFEIKIRAFTEKILSLSAPREFRGTANFPGFHKQIPIIGTMIITPGRIYYEFPVELEKRGRLNIKGEKLYSLKELKYSMITLPLKIYSDKKVVGEAELVYRDPILKFPLSLSFGDSQKAFRPNRVFAKRISHFATAIIPNLNETCDVNTLERDLEKKIDQNSPGINKLIKFSLSLLEIYTLIFFRRSIKKLDKLQRSKLSNRLGSSSIIRLLTLPFTDLLLTTVYTSRNYRVKNDINIPTPPQNDDDEKWKRLHFSPEIQHSKSEIEADVVIIGSGAGGAAMAYRLAKSGLAVAIVEEGKYFTRRDFTANRTDMQNKLYRNQGYQFLLSNSTIWLPTGKCVGGTTTINSGTCIRLPQEIIKRWEKDVGISIDLTPFYPEVERILDVKQVPEELMGKVAKIIQQGIEGTEYRLHPLLRAESGCDGESCCTIGCPIGAKRSTDVSFLPAAMMSGAHLFSQYRVNEILFDGKKAVGVKASMVGFGPEFEIVIKANRVVLAAGTLASPRILHKAGLSRELKHLGKNLTIHPVIPVGAIFDEVVRDKHYIPQSCSVVNNSSFLLEGYTLPPDAIPVVFGLFGSELELVMDKINHFTNFAAMITDSTCGKIIFLGKKYGMPCYNLDKKTVKNIKDSVLLLADIFFRAGAKGVYTPIEGFEKLLIKRDRDRLADANLKPSRFKLSAFHPLGTCRMGNSPKNSVVSQFGEVWGRENLYVVDGSIIPGPLGVNPQVTIMANALRIAQHIEKDIA